MLAGLLAALSALPAPPASPFSPGEQLSYEVTILGATAGSAQLSVGAAALADGVSSWPLVALAHSGGAFETIFPLRDHYVSWWDPTALRAVASRLGASEGGNRYGFLMHFHRGEADYRHWDAKGVVQKVVPLPQGTLDFLSAIYWLRTRPLAPGELDSVSIYMGHDPWPLVARVVGRETIVTAAGAIPCVHLSLSARLLGPLGNRKDLQAWYSDDPRHLPVLLDSELFLGHLRAKLTKIEGAGHP
ncbi:MAG: DUF3108 domain-containing protein [Myxococcales bacterium]